MLNTIYMIESELDHYQPINPIELFIYETEMQPNENIKPAYQQNQGVLTNVVKMLTYLINQAKKIVGNIINSVTSMVDYVFLSPEKKAEYEKYCNYVNSHPDAANKKITVRDWKKIDEGYQNAVKRAESLADKVAKKLISKEDAQSEENSIFEDLTSLGGKAASVVTLNIALRYAKESSSNAKNVSKFLNAQPALLDTMEQSLGEKEIAKFQNKIEKLTHDTYLSRLKSQIMGRKQKTLAQIVDEIITSARDICEVSNPIDRTLKTANLAKNNPYAVKAVAGNLVSDKSTRKQLKTVSDVKNVVGEYGSMLSSVKDMITNNI